MRAIIFTFALTVFSLSEVNAQVAQEYKCPPCGCSDDNEVFDAPGNCPECHMFLINIHDANEGYDYKNLSPQEVCERTASNPDIVLLDVRTAGEFEGTLGRFADAINIPIQEIEDRISEIEKYKDSEVIVYCSASMRSPRVSQLLVDSGFSNVSNMLGGLSVWNSMDEEDLACKNSLRIRN